MVQPVPRGDQFTVKTLSDIAKALKTAGHSSVGALGACWGYKVIIQSEGVTELSAIASAHPSWVYLTAFTLRDVSDVGMGETDLSPMTTRIRSTCP